MKICPKCQESKPHSAYGKNKSRADGLQYQCRQCLAEWYQEYNLSSGNKCECGAAIGNKSNQCVKCAKLGKQNPFWKGGRYTTSSGYVKVLEPSHPNADCKGYVLEHIKVMSEFLGRPIRTEDGELVHHIHDDKSNNNLNNLELCTNRRQPPGQRVEDLVTWARELLRDYGDEYPDG